MSRKDWDWTEPQNTGNHVRWCPGWSKLKPREDGGISKGPTSTCPVVAAPGAFCPYCHGPVSGGGLQWAWEASSPKTLTSRQDPDS